MTEGATDDDRNRCVCDHVLSSGFYLCNRCSAKLAEDLLEVADRHHRLSARPSPQPGRYDRAGSSTPGSKPAARLEVTTLTDLRSGQTEPVLWQGADGKQHREAEHDTPAVLRAVLGWCETVAAERRFTTEPWLPQPTPAATVDDLPRFTMADHDEMTGTVDWVAVKHAALAARAAAAQRRRERWAPTRVVDAAVDWLNRQDEWIARWPAAGELANTVRLLRNRLRSACGDPNARPIGSCVRFVATRDGDKECGAPIFLPPPRPGATPVVRCASRHRHEYDGVDLLRLKLITEQREEAG